ncbi:MAG: hypothetical protein ACLT3D_08455 [Lawsonibacter sp.]
MPEDRRIVQSVEPLFYEGRPDPASSSMAARSGRRGAAARWGTGGGAGVRGSGPGCGIPSVWTTPSFSWMRRDRVCGFNPAATALYRRMGYIGTLAGMPVSNIQPAALSECDQDPGTRRPWPTGCSSTSASLSPPGRPGRRSSSTTSPASGS